MQTVLMPGELLFRCRRALKPGGKTRVGNNVAISCLWRCQTGERRKNDW